MIEFYVWSAVLCFVLQWWYLNWDLEEAWPFVIFAVIPGINTLVAFIALMLLILDRPRN